LEEYKTYNHNPPHLFRDSAKYFITASTYRKVKYLRTNQTKSIVLNSIRFGFNKYNWLLEDWVILDNHYHLIVQAKENADKLPKIINEIHKYTSLKLKKDFYDLIINKYKSDKVRVRDDFYLKL
jgi:REP element-mobilizing transposase RayT